MSTCCFVFFPASMLTLTFLVPFGPASVTV